MAGIREALSRVAHNKNIGRVRARGRLDSGSNEIKVLGGAQYIIIELDDGGVITAYDYGSDIHISDDLKVGDKCILMIRDNWNAEWQKFDRSRAGIRKIDEKWIADKIKN